MLLSISGIYNNYLTGLIKEANTVNYSEQLQAMFLDYFNDYLTVAKFAEHNNLTVDEAEQLIRLGRAVHERLVAELK